MSLRLDSATLTHAARRLGLVGWVGLALLAFAAWGEWGSSAAIQRDIADKQSQARQFRQQAATGKDGAVPQDQPRVLLAALYERMAAPAARPRALEALLKQAQAQGLAVDAVHFHTQEPGLAGVVRHEVSLPVKGSYAALRSWLALALSEQPALSLDALLIKRQQAQTDEAEARATLSLWVKRPVRVASAAAASRVGGAHPKEAKP